MINNALCIVFICSLFQSILSATEIRGWNILSDNIDRVYDDITRTATEFNVRGDLLAGSQISGFLKVANVMIAHGSV